MSYQIKIGDCLESMRGMADGSVDAIVTDPPYGLSFMGKKWDYDVPQVEVWREALRVLKPGGHLLAFAGTRTQHRMAVNIEDAGFEIRDMIAWVYGSGFPKSLNIGKAVDKLQGNERESEIVKGKIFTGSNNNINGKAGKYEVTKGTSPWEGWGTAIKPALEPITVARKPIIGTVAQNVLEHGTGGLNVDGCRVEGKWHGATRTNSPDKKQVHGDYAKIQTEQHPNGRWPANLIHDGSDEVVGLFPQSVSTGGSGPASANWTGDGHTVGAWCRGATGGFGDSGSAARFFYQAKASKRDRDEGLPDGVRSNHPTVKPTDLMRYLCRLITPTGGIILDPFMGSGSTGKAAMLEGFSFIGCEMEAEYAAIADARIQWAVNQKQGELSL